MPRLMDLFCGRWGWSKVFAARGWECVGVDLVESLEPLLPNYEFYKTNVLYLTELRGYDFIVASPPCEQFSVHGMKHFHKNPRYPELGIKLFNHTRQLCEESGLPYVIENVRAAQQFVGNAVHHCGPFYLWGNAVPALLPPRGTIKKNFHGLPGNKFEKVRHHATAMRNARNDYQRGIDRAAGGSSQRANYAATIPIELANCIADYAERLLEQKVCSQSKEERYA